MSKVCLLLCIYAALSLHVDSGVVTNLLQRSTSEQPPTAATTKAPQLYTSNNIPQVDVGCLVHFECKKKLKDAEVPKPCVKYCVKFIVCENAAKIKGKADQCLQLDEEHVRREYTDDKKNGTDSVSVMKVAMIDFPCQPGYLPDYRGRCREVW